MLKLMSILFPQPDHYRLIDNPIQLVSEPN